jgi:hypothetical protein
VIVTIGDPHDAWTMLESSYGSRQSGIQTVINAELTLARWDGQTPITTHRDHMKTLRTRLSAAGLPITAIQFYQNFVNSLPAEYDMVVAIHDPIPSNYSIDVLCERSRAIDLRRELRTTKEGGTSGDQVALLAKQKGSKGRRDPWAVESQSPDVVEGRASRLPVAIRRRNQGSHVMGAGYRALPA